MAAVHALVLVVLSAMLLPPALAQTYTVVTEVAGTGGCSSSEQYTLTYESTWTSTRHPPDYPSSSAHLSPAVVATHSNSYQMWASGSLASSGVQSVAETGATGTLTTELSTAESAGTVLQYQTGSLLDLVGGSTTQSFTVSVDASHQYLSYITMIAPSPDWFAGFQDLLLCRSSNWVDMLEITVQPWDAGTDCGTTYTSSNCAGGTSAGGAAVNIFEFTASTTTSANVFVNNNQVLPVATITITRSGYSASPAASPSPSPSPSPVTTSAARSHGPALSLTILAIYGIATVAVTRLWTES
uniref:Spondin domain-containing protein n=1 Tax=Eutreptiella gymnastica TaxID=73025 RepID=A0A7S4GCP6_9EUGL